MSCNSMLETSKPVFNMSKFLPSITHVKIHLEGKTKKKKNSFKELSFILLQNSHSGVKLYK